MNDELGLRRELRALRRDEHPGRDLWPGIASALPARRRSHAPIWLAVAGAAGLALLFTATVQVPTPEGAPTLTQSGDSGSGMATELATIELAYAQGMHELTAGMDARASLALKVVGPALRELDRMAADLQHEMRDAPEASRELIAELSQTRRQQLKLARTAIMESWS